MIAKRLKFRIYTNNKNIAYFETKEQANEHMKKLENEFPNIQFFIGAIVNR